VSAFDGSRERPAGNSNRTRGCVRANERKSLGSTLSEKSCVAPKTTRPSAQAPLRLSQASRLVDAFVNHALELAAETGFSAGANLDMLLILLASPTGFEPVTPRLGIWCSILLSYGDMRFH
jgi:hypothetical protein